MAGSHKRSNSELNFDRVLEERKDTKTMSRLDEMSAGAPITPTITGGPIPAPELVSTSNAFTQVTIKQLYFFMWKWFAASLLFALPFLILSLIVQMLSSR